MLEGLLKNPVGIVDFYKSFFANFTKHIKKWNLNEKLLPCLLVGLILNFLNMLVGSLVGPEAGFIAVVLTPIVYLISTFIFSSLFFIFCQIFNYDVNLNQALVLHQYFYVVLFPLSLFVTLILPWVSIASALPIVAYLLLVIYFFKLRDLKIKSSDSDSSDDLT